MTELEMSPDVLTVDYEGEPGRRMFFVQARGGAGTYSYLVEKQQVSALAERLRELLLLVDEKDDVLSATPARDPALSAGDPLQLEWRVGTIGLAYEEDDDRIVILLQPVEDDDQDEAENELRLDVEGVRLILRRDQIRSFVVHALGIVTEGRPTCQLCGLPMDPSGHFCPASNGHRLGE
ncbi:MAG: DUF3090 family protein [Actinomycetota bacterium]